MNAIDARFLEILACPNCNDRPPVELKDEELICVKCGRVYPIENGIPIMFVEEPDSEE